MKIRSNDWIFVTGKADSGKTYWIRKHIVVIPPKRLYILDFNRNDYQDLAKQKVNVWDFEGGGSQEAEDFLNTVYSIGNCFAVLEEADNYLAVKTPAVTRFVTTARNRGIGSMVNAKRAKAVLPMYRTRFNYLILFQNTLPEDIEYLEQWAGTGEGSLALLRDLKQGQHVVVNLDRQEISPIRKL